MAVEDREAVDDSVLVRGARAGQAAASRAADGFPGQFVAPNWALVCLSAQQNLSKSGILKAVQGDAKGQWGIESPQRGVSGASEERAVVISERMRFRIPWVEGKYAA